MNQFTQNQLLVLIVAISCASITLTYVVGQTQVEDSGMNLTPLVIWAIGLISTVSFIWLVMELSQSQKQLPPPPEPSIDEDQDETIKF